MISVVGTVEVDGVKLLDSRLQAGRVRVVTGKMACE